MNILSVTQITNYIKSLIEGDVKTKRVFVTGEISNCKIAPSKHLFFKLKDEGSQLGCFMFSNVYERLPFELENGMKVICSGRIELYTPGGYYQLNCFDMQPMGIGPLQKAYEQMKDKLEKEGLFDDSYKKAIPAYPSRIGVATSATGSAVEDIKNVISRRYPLAEIIIAPTIVQGVNAVDDIVASLQLLDQEADVDVIIVGRGGGSIEDLWAFNSEKVARAVFACETPVISAVGHETDFTICDFVSDLRAPTPSAGAELAVPNIEELKERIAHLTLQAENSMDYKINLLERRIQSLIKSPALTRQSGVVNDKILKISNIYERIQSLASHKIEIESAKILSLASEVNSLSPINILLRGFSITTMNDKIVKSVKDVKKDDVVEIRLSDGRINAIVQKGDIN